MERRTTWALPAQAPETWVGGRWTVGLLLALATAVFLPLQRLGPGSGQDDLLLVLAAAGSAVAALVVAYVLVVQSTVTRDDRLRWVATGYAAVAALHLLRDGFLDGPARAMAESDRAAWLTLLLLLVPPLWAVTAGQVRHGLPRMLLPLNALAALALLVVGAPAVLPLLVDDAQQSRPDLRTAAAVALLVAVACAHRWRTTTTLAGSSRPRGPWAWVWVGLVLTAAAAAVHATAPGRWTTLWWTATGTELLALVVPALGLSLVSSAGYRRQSRRWRQLVTEVSRLRAASPLLPGLSVTPEDDEGLPELAEVRGLIDEGRVRVALQPVVRLGDDDVVGYEALSRFGGRVPTDRWFRAASRCGLGGELERVTLHAALELLPQLPDTVFLAVNVSPEALEDETVYALLQACDLTRIVVEVTEHEAVCDYARTRALLEALRSRGARIAVDDTGAGFASLRHVLMLQPDVIKLDTSLTRDVHHSERQQSLVVALAGFAASVGSTVLAEGIETEEQLVALRGLGVPLGQGWHLGVPTVVSREPAPAAQDLVARSRAS